MRRPELVQLGDFSRPRPAAAAALVERLAAGAGVEARRLDRWNGPAEAPQDAVVLVHVDGSGPAWPGSFPRGAAALVHGPVAAADLGRRLAEAGVRGAAAADPDVVRLLGRDLPVVERIPLWGDPDALRGDVYDPRQARELLDAVVVLAPSPRGPLWTAQALADAVRSLAGPGRERCLLGLVDAGSPAGPGDAHQLGCAGMAPARRAAVFRFSHLFLALEDRPDLPVLILEAMAHGVPVAAADTPGARLVLEDAGLYVAEADPAEMAALLRVLLRDRGLLRRLRSAQAARLARLRPRALAGPFFSFLERCGAALRPGPEAVPEPPPDLAVLVDGPFDTSYSLALVNREAARALERRLPGRVAVDFLSRPPGHPRVTPGGFRRHPDLKPLARRSLETRPVEAVLWNSYPPDVGARPGALSVLHSYGWEESLYPADYVRRFAARLDGVTVMSRAVKKILTDAGLPLPIRVSGLGADHVLQTEPQPYRGDLGRSFRFLHVSSGFPRKGVDVLLEAYARAFSHGDDVSLVIKTFPNPHNRVREQVEQFRKRPGSPHVVLIDRDLPDAVLADIYRRCHAFVSATRGEGFGLPMAEAMLWGLPVIVTEGSGQADFCTPETAWLIRSRYAEARSHLSGPGSVWLEPDPDHLAQLLRAVYEADPEEREPRIRRARDGVRARFTWDAWAGRTLEALEAFRRPSPWREAPVPVAWVSTWGGRCGIARYSQYLLSHRGRGLRVTVLAPVWEDPVGADPPWVRRVWDRGDAPEAILGAVEACGARAAVIQYHPAFFDPGRLTRLAEGLLSRNVAVFLVLHAARLCAEELSRSRRVHGRIDRILVHTVEDLNLLKDAGLDGNAALFPHGVPHADPVDPAAAKARFGLKGRRVVAAFGFLMPHKGIRELIRAFRMPELADPDLFLLLATAEYPSEASRALARECRRLVRHGGLERRCLLLTDFLSDEAALALLQAADLVVFPYQHTRESSSAAVRFGLAARRPVAVTPLPIFRDVREVVHELPGTSAADLARGILALLGDRERLHARARAQEAWLAAHRWPAAAERLEGLIRSVLVNREDA
ncbi:MAG: glycosyltransferase [Desulfacinum sp.]|jgi:glycosyltransferase involved in cell wall biosynthesis|nr:glycosyltransferase [Desulfacinum sp.]